MNQHETQKHDKGFTLIELLIVIVILGVLAAVIVFRVSNVTDSANKNACQLEVRAINTASEAYKASNGSYAASLAALKTAGLIDKNPLVDSTASSAYSPAYATGVFSATCPA